MTTEEQRSFWEAMRSRLNTIGETCVQFYERFLCRDGSTARSFSIDVADDFPIEIPGQWFTFKEVFPPQEYIDVVIQPGSKTVRWYRGDVKYVDFDRVTIKRPVVAFTCVFVFGRGVPDRTCCFEVREAPERLTIWQGVYVNASSGGVQLLAPNTSGKRITVIVQNQGVNVVPANDLVYFTPGGVGFRLAQGRDATFVGVPANAGFTVYSIGANTPPIHATFLERL